MVQAIPSPPNSVDSQLILYDVSWETYEKLLEIFAERSTPRLTYYKGTLELMTPLPEHETYSWTLGRLVVVLSEELGLEIRGLKSTTWRSQPKQAGKEADECFYIQNEAKVRGKLNIDLRTDPPPDLVIEIDLSRSSMDKMAIYAELGIPEVWRWRNGNLSVHLLQDGKEYIESETSLAFESFPVKELIKFITPDLQKGENARMREFRKWVRSQ
ncbi:MAG: Uma2 family endonuclease [Lyngbya sp.]|nr:Uma2 family endonuclease [Lyngbya sp.]